MSRGMIKFTHPQIEGNYFYFLLRLDSKYQYMMKNLKLMSYINFYVDARSHLLQYLSN